MCLIPKSTLIDFPIIIYPKSSHLELMSTKPQTSTLYEDKDLKITPKQVIIKCYYFPIGQSKHIPFERIRSVTVKPLKYDNTKLWGMGIATWGHWLPRDFSRMEYTHFVALDTNTKVTPSFTCTDMPTAVKVISKELEMRKSAESESGTQCYFSQNKQEDVEEEEEEEDQHGNQHENQHENEQKQ